MSPRSSHSLLLQALASSSLTVSQQLTVTAAFAFIYPTLRQHAERQPRKASLQLVGSCPTGQSTGWEEMDVTLSTARGGVIFKAFTSCLLVQKVQCKYQAGGDTGWLLLSCQGRQSDLQFCSLLQETEMQGMHTWQHTGARLKVHISCSFSTSQ